MANIIELIIKGKDVSSAELSKVQKNLDEIGKRMQKVGTVSLAAGTAIASGLFAIAQKTAAAADEVKKFERATGISQRTLTALSYAIQRWGGQQSDVDTGLRRLTKALSDADRGMAMYVDTFKSLGVKIHDTNYELKSVEQILPEIAEAFVKIENDTKKAALAQELFGRGGLKLVPLLNQGAKGLEELTERADKLGLMFSEKTSASAEQFQDSMLDLRSSIAGVTYALGTQLMPIIIPFIDKAVDIAIKVRKWVEEHEGLAMQLVKLAGILAGGGALLLGLGTFVRLVNAATIGLVALQGATAGWLLKLAPLLTALGPAGAIAIGGALLLGFLDRTQKTVDDSTIPAVKRLEDEMDELAKSTVKAGEFIGRTGKDLDDAVHKAIEDLGKKKEVEIKVIIHGIPDITDVEVPVKIGTAVQRKYEWEILNEELMAAGETIEQLPVKFGEASEKMMAMIDVLGEMIFHTLWYGFDRLFHRILVGTETLHGLLRSMWRMFTDFVIAEIARMVAAWMAAQMKMLAARAIFNIIRFLLPVPTAGMETGWVGGARAQYGGVVNVGSRVLDTVPVFARKGEAFLDTSLTDKLRRFIEQPIQRTTNLTLNAGIVNTTRQEAAIFSEIIREGLELHESLFVTRGYL